MQRALLDALTSIHGELYWVHDTISNGHDHLISKKSWADPVVTYPDRKYGYHYPPALSVTLCGRKPRTEKGWNRVAPTRLEDLCKDCLSRGKK